MGGFEVVDPRYSELFDRAVAVLGTDERVASVRLSGSLASHTADSWSDLDVVATARTPATRESLVNDWESWLRAITPTVFARRPLAPWLVNALTPEGLAFDILLVDDDESPAHRPTGYAVGFLHRDRFEHRADAVEYAVHEQLRGLAGPLPKFLMRGQHVEHFMGVGHTFGILATVVAVAEDAPLPARGVVAALPAEVVAAIPPVAPTFDSLLVYELAIAREVVTRARPLFARYNLEWPTALEAVAARRVQDVFGVDTGEWLVSVPSSREKRD